MDATIEGIQLRLQVEWFQGNVLRCHQQFAHEGRFRGAPAQGLLGGKAYKIGIIVFLRNMRQHQIPRTRVKTFGIAQKFADGVIGEMSCPRKNPLLDDPRIRANLQHIQIVIGLKNQTVRFAQMHFDKLRHVPEVCADSHLRAIGPKRKPDGIGGIVRNREGVHVDIPDRKALAGLNRFGALQPLPKRVGKDALQRVHRRFGHIKRRFPKPEDLRQAVAMVRMFVRDQDSVEVFKFSPDGGQARERFPFTQPGVNKDAGAFGFEQRQIARTAGRQYGDAQAD
jgi:hypothetical protein